jgi:hypothetical protein
MPVGPKADHASDGKLLRAIDDHEGQGMTRWALQLASHVFVRPGELCHPLHQRCDMRSTRRLTLLPEQVAQHPAADERVEQVQLADPAHDRQVGRRYGPRRRMIAVEHRFALGNRPTFPSVPVKKSFASVSSSILAYSTVTLAARSTAADSNPNTSATPACAGAGS